jgi:DNA-binding CsgD family transcriptional regulator
MKPQIRYAILAAGLFILLALLDQWRAQEPFDIWNFLGDMCEWALLAGAVAMTAATSAQTRDFRLERLELLDDLAKARAEGSKWRMAAASHMAGLSQAIAAQFKSWSLTDAEADVAGLMLKGLSHREIASLRKCSEVTVRQHATMVYRKSGLSNRAQLTAFFLEDLLPDADPVARPVLVSIQ